MLFVTLRIEDYNSYQGWAQLKVIRAIINYDVYIYTYTYIYTYMCIYMYTYTYNFVKWTIVLSDNGRFL